METNITYRGEKYALHVVTDRDAWKADIRIDVREKELTVRLFDRNPEFLKNVLLNWYYRQAREAIKERLDFYGPLTGKAAGHIRIKDQKTRWGSCSSKGNLNFNWRLILLPPDLLDYVVVHELCHLKEMNHSKSFWMEVEKILPDYRERRNRLREWKE